MCSSNRSCYIFLEIIVYLHLIIVIILGWFKVGIEPSSKLEILSILVAVAVFYVGWRINRHEHKKNQLSLLNTLKFKIEEIETMVNSYKKEPLPFYLLPQPNESLYYKELDYKIEGKSTDDLKFYIRENTLDDFVIRETNLI